MVVLACVDGSAYGPSVCDHAGWLAGALGESLELLHVREAGESARAADQPLREARRRLGEHGLSARRVRVGRPPLLEAVVGLSAEIVVAGKRGALSDGDRGRLGSNAQALLLHGRGLLCLVAKLHLPIRRALVVTDASLSHHAAIRTVAASPIFADLDLDVIVLEPNGCDASEKLGLTRLALGDRTADVYALPVGAVGEAAATLLSRRGVDLIVAARETLLDASAGSGLAPDAGSLWRIRTPLIIC